MDLWRFITEQFFTYLFLLIAGASVKSIIVLTINHFRSKKILDDIQTSQKIRSAIQRAEYTRAAVGADRVLVTQLHNGGRFISGRSMNKLSIVQDLSIDSLDSVLLNKSFDRALVDVYVSQFADILSIATSRRNYDIISTSDLGRDFIFNNEVKNDKINYIIIVKIQRKKKILGYLFYIFTGENVPEHNRNNINKLINLGLEIGELVK